MDNNSTLMRRNFLIRRTQENAQENEGRLQVGMSVGSLESANQPLVFQFAGSPHLRSGPNHSEVFEKS